MNEFSAIINYIEEHLEDNIDMKKIEQLARVSEYNFQKIFSVLSGLTLGDYIRKRRHYCRCRLLSSLQSELS